MKFQHCEDWVEFWKTTVQMEIPRSNEQQEWVDDGSVDVKRRPVLRKKTGGWKASLFIIGSSLYHKYC